MKVNNDATRVFERPPVSASRVESSRTQSAAPTDKVQISAAAGELSTSAEVDSKAKVDALRSALAKGENIVDPGRIADGILADARGGT